MNYSWIILPSNEIHGQFVTITWHFMFNIFLTCNYHVIVHVIIKYLKWLSACYRRAAWKANEHLAQGNALGIGQDRQSPSMGKSMMVIIRLMPLQGDLILNLTQGNALGCSLIGLSDRLSSNLRNLNHLNKCIILTEFNAIFKHLCEFLFKFAKT